MVLGGSWYASFAPDTLAVQETFGFIWNPVTSG